MYYTCMYVLYMYTDFEDNSIKYIYYIIIYLPIAFVRSKFSV